MFYFRGQDRVIFCGVRYFKLFADLRFLLEEAFHMRHRNENLGHEDTKASQRLRTATYNLRKLGYAADKVRNY